MRLGAAECVPKRKMVEQIFFEMIHKRFIQHAFQRQLRFLCKTSPLCL